MIKKILLIGSLCLLIIISFLGCSSNQEKKQPSAPPKSTISGTSSKEFTVTDLKKYDGQNSTSAYVAVDGIVYDVTNANGWKNGSHKSGITAGKDLSKEVISSPHGKDVLKNLTVVGKLKK